MKRPVFILFSTLGIIFSCNNGQNTNNSIEKDSIINYSAIVLTDTNSTPTVDISKYTLIHDPLKDRTNDAKEILEVKKKWPLAMQSLNSLEFDSILSKNFVFKGTDSFYTRAAYIKNRTTPHEWKITFVKYDNVTLQFFGDTGILSYKNHITNKNTKTEAIEFEHISWVDIFVLENGKWKIGGAHAIDYRLELSGK